MAKTVKPAATAESEDVVTVTAVEIIPKANEQQALELINPFKAMLVTLKEQYGNVQITDKASLELAQKGVATMTKLRNQVEKRRLEIFRPVLDLQKKVKAETDAFQEEVKLIEQPIRDTINAEELRLQAEAQAEHLKRVGSLQESGWTLVGQFYTCGTHRILFDQIDTADEEQVSKWVEIGQAELARVAEEERLRKLRESELAAKEAELKRQESELAAKLARLEELERREAELNAKVQPTPIQETSALQQILANEPPQPPPPPPAPEPVLVVQSNNVPEGQPQTTGYVTPAQQTPNIGTIVSQTTPEGEYTGPVPDSLKELADLRGKSISFLMSSPEFGCFWNMAIDNVLLRFTNEVHNKGEWIDVFKLMRK